MRKYFEIFNSVTNTIANISWWYSSMIWSATTGCFGLLWNIRLGLILLFFAMLMTGCKLIVFIREKYFKKIEEPKEEYITLKEAAEILSNANFIKNLPRDQIEHLSSINQPDLPGEVFWQRDNPDKIHKETLPKGTVGLINLTLHVCRKNNVKIYGKRPSFSEYNIINFKEIHYFSTDYTKLYPDISRDPTSLIYSDVSIIKEDFKHAINNTEETEHGKVLHESLYGTRAY